MTNTNETMIYLNTWKAYNEGCEGYGWFNASDAREFIEEDTERDGGEWFIADIDNYLGVSFSNLEYCNVMDVINTIETLEDMDEWERKEVVALMEYLTTEDVQEAIDRKDYYIFYEDTDAYFDSMDDLIDFSGCNEVLARYFDYDAYHRDLMFDAYEAENGIVICG
jgi:antirestriction protein